MGLRFSSKAVAAVVLMVLLSGCSAVRGLRPEEWMRLYAETVTDRPEDFASLELSQEKARDRRFSFRAGIGEATAGKGKNCTAVLKVEHLPDGEK